MTALNYYIHQSNATTANIEDLSRILLVVGKWFLKRCLEVKSLACTTGCCLESCWTELFNWIEAELIILVSPPRLGIIQSWCPGDLLHSGFCLFEAVWAVFSSSTIHYRLGYKIIHCKLCRLNIHTSAEDCVHTDAVDCSSDFIPDALFLTPFNPTSQAGKRHIFSLFFFSFQKKPLFFHWREVSLLCCFTYLHTVKSGGKAD